MGMKVTEDYQWKCSFDDCDQKFERYSNIVDHIENDHPSDEKLLYANLGNF
jgi:hypothetical protein